VSLDDVADDVVRNVIETSQCSSQLALDASSDQQEQLAVDRIVCDAAASTVERGATAAVQCGHVALVSTSACREVAEASQQHSQQLQQTPAAAVAKHSNHKPNGTIVPLTDTTAALQRSVELLSSQLKHATVHSTDTEQQFDDTHGLSEAAQHDVAVYALEFLLSDVMYELVNDVADTALLQRRNMLVNAADYVSRPLQARLQQAAQQCGEQLSVQQTLQQLQHCIDDAAMIGHSDGVAVVQHLKQQLEDMYTKNTGTLTDAQVLQVWSAAQREQGQAARFELALARTAVAAATQQQQQQRCNQSVDTAGLSGLATSDVAYEASMLSQYSENALSDRHICNDKQTDTASRTPSKQRRA
jgi:hypothetical protein